MQSAIDAQASVREGFDPELEIEPARLQELRTSRPATLADLDLRQPPPDTDAAAARLAELEEIDADALAARSSEEADRGAAGQAGPSGQRQAEPAPGAAAAELANQAAQEAPGSRGPGAGEGVEGRPEQGRSPKVSEALGSPPDPSRIPKRDRVFIERAEAEAADLDGIAAGADTRLAEIDLARIKARADAGDVAAIDLLEQLDDAKAREASWSALLGCLGEAS